MPLTLIQFCYPGLKGALHLISMIALPSFKVQLIPPLLGDCPLRFDPNINSNFLTYASQCSAAIKTILDYKTGLEGENLLNSVWGSQMIKI